MRAIDADDTREELIATLRDCFNVTYELVDVVATTINNMPTIQPEPHWIPVTERLPEEEGEYLVTSVYQYYRDGRKTYKTTVDRWSRNGAGKEWVATSNDAHIAWMPLPEPYKGVTT